MEGGEEKRGVHTPVVSVIIPTFNRPALLREAVRSVLSQTFSRWEIIIVDNGSDSCFQPLIRALSRMDDRISLYSFPSNGGASAARNRGIEEARGEYLLFLDDDDLLHPRMLESSIAVFLRSPATDIVTCLSGAFIDPHSAEQPLPFGAGEKDDNLPVTTYPLNHPDYAKLDRVAFSTLLHHTLIIHSCLVRKRAIGEIRFPEDLRAGEDTLFWLSLAARGSEIVLLKRVLAYVRFHRGSSRADSGYDEAVVRFFMKLLSSGLAADRHSSFLAHAHLALKLFRMRRPEMLAHLLAALRSPDLIVRYLFSYHRAGARRMRRLYRFLERSRAPRCKASQCGPAPNTGNASLEKINCG